MASLEHCLTLYNLDPADADQIRQMVLNREDGDMRAALDEFVGQLEEERQDVLDQVAGSMEQDARTLEQDTSSDAFQQWFGDGKVVNPDGSPKVVYHGTRALQPFAEFSQEGADATGRWTNDPDAGIGFHFSEDREIAGGYGDVGEYYLSAQNILEINSDDVSAAQKEWLNDLKTDAYSDTDTSQDSLELVEFIEGTNAFSNPGSGFYNKGLELLARDAERRGYDGVSFKRDEDPWADPVTEYIVFNPAQIKSVDNRGTWNPNDPRILYQSAAERIETRGPVRAPRGATYMGVGPQYTVENNSADAPVFVRNAPMIQASTNAKNAEQQSDALDVLLEKHPDPLSSLETWVALANDAFSLERVPMPPWRTMEIVNGGADAVAQEIGQLSEGMVRDAEAGLETARQFKEVYESGQATPDITAKSFLWSFLSRGVNPYVQEGAFLDAIMSDQLTGIMERAVAEGWNDTLDAEYSAWAKTAIPVGSPGRGTQHNLNAFGRNFMRVMTQRHADADNKTGLEIIHDMIVDGVPSYQIRREFLRRGENAGIDNKVVSFTLLLLGRDDVLVLDRVQVRNQWNDGRFDGQNIYDTDLTEDGKQANGTAFAEMTFGHKGLLYYEAMERALKPIIEQGYAQLGIKNGSLGRYHWDSWLLASNQEVGHASVKGLLRDAQGAPNPYVGAFVRQGKYNGYDYGFRYGVMADDRPHVVVEKPDGSGSVVIPPEVMSDPKSPFRKTVSKLKTAAMKRDNEAGTTKPWTAALTSEEVQQYGEAADSAGTPAENIRPDSTDAIGRVGSSANADYGSGTGSVQDAPAGRTLNQDEFRLNKIGSGEFEQRRSSVQGSIELPSGGVMDGTKVINLFESENTSTFFHELGHLSLEAMLTLSADPAAPQQLQADMATVREYLGMEADQASPTTAQHETWARTFEAYLMEGKSPSLELTTAMARIKAWFARIYGSVRTLRVEMNDDVREVLDRMLATSEQIEVAQQEVQQAPMFTSATAAGMSASEWEAYQKLTQRRTAEADRRLTDKMMEKVRRRTEKEYQEREAQVRAEVTAEVAEQPVYQAIRGMTDKNTQDKARLDKGELVDVYGEQVLQDLTRERHGTRKHLYTTNAARLGEIADLYGYDRHQDLIRDLQAARPFDEVVEEQTRARMDAEYGDPLNDGTVEAEAMDAIHNDQAGQVMAAELRTLAKQAGRPDASLRNRIFKARAAAILDGMQERHVLPDQFLAAERKAARAAEVAFRKVATGKNPAAALAEAYQAKEQQVLNHHLYMQARDWRKKMDRMRKKMRTYSKADVRRKIGSPHIEQIEAILEDYDFKKRTQRDVNNYISLRQYIDLMTDGGRLPDGTEVEGGRAGEMALDRRVVERANQQHYSRLTVEELNGLFDTVTNIESLGRRKNEVRTKRRTRELNTLALALYDKVFASHKVKADQPEGVAGATQQYITSISRVDTILARLDGGEEMGLWYDAIKRDIDEAMSELQKLQVEIAEAEVDLFTRYYDKSELRDLAKERNIDGAGVWTKEQILVIALNMGTESNHQRIMDPNVEKSQRMSQQRLDALLNTLDERDWHFVQDTWNYINSWWDQLAAVEQRSTGVVPKKVEAKMMWEGAPSFVQGGYYRLYYDPKKDARASKFRAKEYDEFQNAGMGARAHVRNGMTFQRNETAGGQPVQLELRNLGRQLNDTVRLIALKEAVDATQRVLSHGMVTNAFRETGQLEVQNQLQLWLDDVAVGPIFNADWLNGSLRALKNNFVMSRLAFNLKTIALQLTGVSHSVVAIGPTAMVDGYYQAWKGTQMFGEGLVTEIMGKSPFMAERVNTFQKDINDFFESGRVNSVFASSYQKGKEAIARAGFAPIQWTQFYGVDLPTWVGAYRQAVRQGKNEADAINYADRMVARSQDSGMLQDRSGVERGTMSNRTRQADIVRIWTALGGYMLTKMNRANMQILKARYGWRNTDSAAARAGIAARLSLEMMILFLTEPAAMALLYAAFADDDDRELENVLRYAGEEVISGAVGGLPLLREVYTEVQGFKSGGVFGGAIASIGDLKTQVEQGEMDQAAVKAGFNALGYFTGLPTTQMSRIVVGIMDHEETGDLDIPAMAVGANPLSFR